MAVRSTKVPAPLGGWNTRDPISSMPPTDAVEMTNLIPDVDGVTVRPGYSQYAELISGGSWVNGLLNWKTQYGERLIAASHTGADHRLFDITTTVSTLKSGLMGSKWNGAVMSGALGIVNGVDDPQRLTYAPGPGVLIGDMNITGVPAASRAFNVIEVHKSRSYFANGDEPAFWYSAVNTLGGSLTRFPIDIVDKTSGNVVEIGSWTRDGGGGPDDFFVIFLDTGGILVYQGSNPGDASDWSLVGRYQLGRVLATVDFGGKIHVVTDADYNTFPDDLLAEGLRRPSKLSGAARDAVMRDRTDNWQILVDPVKGWRIVNVPYGGNREQHLLNLRSGGACRTDYPAQSWAIYKGELYFGSNDGVVYKIRDGDDNGSSIAWSVKQAYTDFRIPNPKMVRNYSPFFTTQGNFSYESGVAFDYNSRDFIQSITTSAEGPVWDTSPWDTTAWGAGRPAKKDWLFGAGRGQNVSLQMDGVSTKKVTWHHTDYRLEIADDIL